MTNRDPAATSVQESLSNRTRRQAPLRSK